MKASSRILESIDKVELDRLAKEVRETVAFDHSDQGRSFTTVDLWNIHRAKKTASSRRSYLQAQ